MTQPFVQTLNADVATVVGTVEGDLVLRLAATPASDFILPFDPEAEAAGFVGRDAVFAAIDDFAARNPCGYVEIVADAGLGKTALAAEIARRRDAIVFFASAGRGTQHAAQFLAHVSAELLARHLPDRKTLPASVGENATTMVQLLRTAVPRAPSERVWVVVDGLDEADPPPPGANALLLPVDLPAGAFFVVTRRTGSLVTGPGTPVRRCELRRDDPQQTADVRQFLEHRLPLIAAALAHEGTSVDDLVDSLAASSDGNFAYLSYVLADLAQARPGGVDLAHLPDKLSGYYDQFWARMKAAQEQDWDTWKQVHKPVLERLAVAAEAVSANWLGTQLDRDPDEIEARVLEPWARLLSRDRRSSVPTWRIVHRSFADYLAESGKVSLADAHRDVARVYLATRFESWDDYGLRHAASHLADAATKANEPVRHELTGELAKLVADGDLYGRQLALGDPKLIERDLQRARDVVAQDESDEATLWLVRVSMSLLGFRRELLQPEAVFATARRGDLDRAQQLLDLLGADLDDEWREALRLALAWLAAEAQPAGATGLRDAVREQRASVEPGSPVLDRLFHRVAAALDGAAIAPEALAEVPAVADAEAMVERLAGSGMYASLQYDRERLLSGDGYMAAIDGPALVALALSTPDPGERLLHRYIELHAAYGYQQYRSRSLWWLLDAVLADPDPARTRERVAEIGMALLAPVRGDFLEGLDIARLTVQADAHARETLRRRRDDALATAAGLPPGAGTAQPAQHGRSGDVWATHRRRLAALGESAAVEGVARETIDELLEAAARIPGGFAGFTAPAFLMLAESASIARSGGDVDIVRWSLRYAARTAANIRDPVYCLRVTARVAAMQTRWWPGPEPGRLAAVVEALARDPSAREFSTIHVVGRPLDQRRADGVPVQPERFASLRELSELYMRPLADFIRLNGGDPDQALPAGAEVNVPDPGFPALLAARLAAAVLAQRPARGDRLIRRLVPVAGGEPTALATTLSRLILSMTVDDRRFAEELRALTERLVAEP